jgi:CRISPR/Cas system-associated exonuclease Cas4 (RecB family)
VLWSLRRRSGGKNFTSGYVVQGQLVHAIIDRQIQRHCENRPMDPAGVMTAFAKTVSLYRNTGGETFTEYHNGEVIPDAFFTAMDENGKACLRTFFGKWPDYESRECVRHEEHDHFTVGDIGVTVKVDFVGRLPDGTLVLTDWKTGRDEVEEEPGLQMAVYVLWAQEYYRKSADEIRAELVFLQTGETRPYAFFQEQLQEVREMIIREFETMNTSYEYGDFPARPSQRECRSCTFAEVCPETAIRRA